MLYNFHYHEDQDYFIKKRKRRGEICIIPLYPKSMQTLFYKIEKIEDSSSDESSGILNIGLYNYLLLCETLKVQ